MYLLELKRLEYLDLSNNYFNISQIPASMGSMKQLRYLNLSNNLLTGVVPHELGNLTNLQRLDLSSCNELEAYSLSWASKLHEMRYPANINHLDLSYNNLGGEFPQLLQNFTSLQYLDLSWNGLRGNVPLWTGKLQSITHLDLHQNNLSSIEGGSIWGLVCNLCSLRVLHLSNNKFQGSLLEAHQNLSTNYCSHFDLQSLDLSFNSINGRIPFWLGEEFMSLRYLHLSFNMLSGEIPSSLGNLSGLEELYLDKNNLSSIATSFKFPPLLQTILLSGNPLTGTVLTEIHFANLTSLTLLDMGDTFLTLNLPSSWLPPFRLQTLEASTCKINGPFPHWLQNQINLTSLGLSNANISRQLPNWFQNLSNLVFVNLAHNNLSGYPIFPVNFYTIDLSHNSLSAFISNGTHEKKVYSSVSYIDLSYNFISGQLPEDLPQTMPSLTHLSLSNKQLSGGISNSVCQLSGLDYIALQNNMLTGTIPQCWANASSLEVIDLSNNLLKGSLPCFTDSLGLMLLSDNLLSEQIPACWSNLTNLEVLDIGGNNLSGKLSTLISRIYLGPKILRLRANKFSGFIPSNLCTLPQLQILDLGDNNFSGPIPRCLGNFAAMRVPISSNGSILYAESDINEVVQGTERAYTSTLKYLGSIDLSCNNLVGNIPPGITDLAGLLNLNLSFNQLSGTIPKNTGGMKALVSLDLSRNKLSGGIPTSMNELNFLGDLNLSYNNLSGQIPIGNQLQTLTDPSIYEGNPFLCGDSLPRNAPQKMKRNIVGQEVEVM